MKHIICRLILILSMPFICQVSCGFLFPDLVSAKEMLIEKDDNGKVFFIIGPAGEVLSLKIVKASRYPLLNQAALKAVEKSAPFSRPPSSLFKGDLKLELTIQFELT